MKLSVHSPPVWVVLAIVGIFAVAMVYALLIYAPCDDTYIYLVYVKNLLAGNGLTFNAMKVQGFTSVLWTLLLAAFGWVLPIELPTLADRLSMASGLFVLVATYAVGRRMGLSRPKSLLVPLLLAGTWDFVFYMGDGLETLIFTGFLVLSMGYVVTDDADRELRSVTLPVVLSLAILARPEGILVAAIVIGYLTLRAGTLSVVRCFIWMLIFLVPIAVLLRLYYGSWLPNTFYAKAGAGLSNVHQGVVYTTNFVKAEWPVLAILLTMIVLWVRRKDILPPAPFLLLVLTWLADVSIRGGDNMVGFRAVFPVVPLIYLTIVYGARRLGTRSLLAAVVAISAFHVVSYNFGNVIGGTWGVSVTKQADNWKAWYDVRKDFAMELNKELQPGSIVALTAAGVIPYYTDFTTIDMLGLNNEYIAHRGKRDRSLAYGHQAGDGNYVMSQEPDVIFPGGAGPRQGTFFLSDREVTAHPDFKRLYKSRVIGEFQGATLRAYFRKRSGRRSSGSR